MTDFVSWNRARTITTMTSSCVYHDRHMMMVLRSLSGPLGSIFEAFSAHLGSILGSFGEQRSF